MVIQSLPSPDEYTKTLGIEWNTGMDHFRITIARLPPLDNITKRMLVSDRAKTYDVLGWSYFDKGQDLASKTLGAEG